MGTAGFDVDAGEAGLCCLAGFEDALVFAGFLVVGCLGAPALDAERDRLPGSCLSVPLVNCAHDFLRAVLAAKNTIKTSRKTL